MTIVFTASLAGLFSSCGEIPSDRLYALWLEESPAASDWERALPHIVSVRGGRPHRLRTFSEIDDDTVHTTTASCHHGSRLPEPVDVEMRAFYTDDHLYLQLTWEDVTRDDRLQDWVFDGQRWQNTGQFEDGFGLIWDARGSFPVFSCAYACHINDFGVNQDSFHATNKMKLNVEDSWLDLWNWKASRTARLGFADDRYLNIDGMQGDVAGELYLENSRASTGRSSHVRPFSEEDQPVYDAQGRLLTEISHDVGAKVPGYLVTAPQASRADVSAEARHVDGRWQVTLRRALQTGDPQDVVFVPGDEMGVAFGLALMDHTPYEHYASQSEQRLVLLPPQVEYREVGKSYGVFSY